MHTNEIFSWKVLQWICIEITSSANDIFALKLKLQDNKFVIAEEQYANNPEMHRSRCC